MKRPLNRLIWNVKALLYRGLRSFFVYRRIYEAEIRPFKKWLAAEFHPKEKYLDLATGSGDSLKIYPPTLSPVGCDFSFSMLRLLKAKRPVPLVQAEAAELPFRDGVFAGITAIGLAEYISAPGNFLSELSRILGKGGWLAITISQPNVLNLLRNLSGNRLRYDSIRTFSQLAAGQGFQLLQSNKTLFQCQLLFRK
ncbi:MAG: methyltransferase domain-containing protein [Calditrichaeota bacterium]|nr:methyltransferase domain-containing protein [Calditrichota bacterium]